MTSNPGQTVLATVNNQSTMQGYRPRLIEFYGYEGEDFRHFLEILESYLAPSNTNSDSRKLIKLKSQLRRAAKVHYENVILRENKDPSYDQVVERLKEYYITSELIQNYEMEFNDMYQGDQEHPQIFLSRLREAADLANIDSESVIEARFRAGLIREIKQFCIQSSSRRFKDWINHAEGWWNANRPRKITMVDNPFIPRNVNNALIYQDHDELINRHKNHSIELVDTAEQSAQRFTVNNSQNLGKIINPTDTTQLTTLDITGQANDSHYQIHQQNRHHHGYSHNSNNNQQGILELIQQAIRSELKSHDTTNNNQEYNHTGYNNNSRFNNNNGNRNHNSNRNGYNNNSIRNGYNNTYGKEYNNYSNNGYNNNSNNGYNNNYSNGYNNKYGNGYVENDYNGRRYNNRGQNNNYNGNGYIANDHGYNPNGYNGNTRNDYGNQSGNRQNNIQNDQNQTSTSSKPAKN